jgi:hypothetical protein
MIHVFMIRRGGSNSDEDLLIDSDDGIFGEDDKFSIHPLLSLQDAEEKILKLAALYKLKKLELQTVLMNVYTSNAADCALPPICSGP